MKSIRKVLGALLVLVGFITLLNLLHAQDTATPFQMDRASVAGMSDMEVLLTAVESLPATPADAVPQYGTFWSAQHAPGSAEEWPPMPGNIKSLPVWDMGDGIYLLDDRSINYNAPKPRLTLRKTSVDLNPADGDDDDTNSDYDYSPSFVGTPVDTNGLWLQIFGVSNGAVALALNNATDAVYEVMSVVSLDNGSNNWNIEMELWPSDTNSMPFTVAQLDRTNTLFLRAMDWTGVTHGGNETPDWWLWKYFGTTGLSDTNLDNEGNTVLSDYQNGIDPNIISFTLAVTNNYVNSMSVPVQLDVTAGIPSYYAVSVDDTNFAADSGWQTFAGTNLNVYLGLTQGWHDVWVGLKGRATNATVTWQWKHLNLTLPPMLVITNPTASTVSQPMIQIYGYSQESLASISYDISNAVGVVTGLQSEITDRYYDTNSGDFTTNYFECLDVPLTNGLNTVTLHATDLAGNATTTNFSYTLDYSGKSPPGMQIIWPQNGTQISGGSFTLRGTMDDPTATVTTQLLLTNSGVVSTNIYSAEVERNGKFWLENLPLAAGTNAFTITATDAIGNTTATNISVIQSALAFTVNPVTPASQLWQPTVNLTGTISISSYAVWVNGVKGHNNGSGTWSASNVPVNQGGTASFTATAYAPTEQQPDGSFGN